jgi:hypothetical protein
MMRVIFWGLAVVMLLVLWMLGAGFWCAFADKPTPSHG